MINQFTKYFQTYLVSSALRCLETKLRNTREMFKSSEEVLAYLKLQLAHEQNECFAVLFLNNQHRLLAFEKVFHGTVNEVTVYPRVIAKKALEYNSAAIVLAHNHPSGECAPSKMDKEITQVIWSIFRIIDIELLDHIIVSPSNAYSFAEHGLL